MTTATEHGASLRQLKEVCESLRSVILSLQEEKTKANASGRQQQPFDKNQLMQHRWQILMLLRTMKGGLRNTFLAADEWKSRVQEKKDIVEAHQLKLQNLLYEKDHLLREIRRCRGFSMKEMDKIEFENEKLPISVDPEVHRQHLDQLTNELEARKRMKAELKQLKEKIEKIEVAAQAKQTFLDGLRQEVSSVEVATKGLQEYMGVPVTAQLNRQHEANQLSAPLYALFCELEAYCAVSEASSRMSLAVVDAKSINHRKSVQYQKRSFPSALEGSATGPEPEQAPSKRQKGSSRSPSVSVSNGSTIVPSRSPSVVRSKKSSVDGETAEMGEIVENNSNTAEKLLALRPHEESKDEKMEIDNGNEESKEGETVDDLWQPSEKALRLSLTLTVDDTSDEEPASTHSFAVLFQYYPIAKIITAELVNGQSSTAHHGPTAQSNINNVNVLMNLFPGDDGREVPRLACNYEFIQTDNGEIQFPADSAARPFYWAQWICGLYPLKRVEGDGSDSIIRRPEPSIRNVMDQLVKRLVTSVCLKRHLEQLVKTSSSTSKKQDVVQVHPLAKTLFTGEIKTVLESWKEISAPSEDIFQLVKGQLSERSLSSHFPIAGCRYYRAVFKNDRAKVSAIVEIAPEYPIRAPRFLFQPKTMTMQRNEDGQLPIYENQLKEMEIEVNAYYDELIPAGTERFLLMHQLRKVQICFDVLSNAANDGKATLCFGRERRGKDRRQAIVMDSTSKELRHR